MIRKYAEIFCWKNVSSFCSAKATHIFSAKNIRILCIESAKTVNEMTLNELIKLTTLWTTGPWHLGSFTLWCVHPEKFQISLNNHAVWSVFLGHSEDSQGSMTSTGWQWRIIILYGCFAMHTCTIVTLLTLIRLHDAQADLGFHCPHMPNKHLS